MGPFNSNTYQQNPEDNAFTLNSTARSKIIPTTWPEEAPALAQGARPDRTLYCVILWNSARQPVALHLQLTFHLLTYGAGGAKGGQSTGKNPRPHVSRWPGHIPHLRRTAPGVRRAAKVLAKTQRPMCPAGLASLHHAATWSTSLEPAAVPDARARQDTALCAEPLTRHTVPPRYAPSEASSAHPAPASLTPTARSPNNFRSPRRPRREG